MISEKVCINMKKVIALILVLVLAIIPYACDADTAPDVLTQICVDKATWLLSELDALLDRDDGMLWGIHLRGPFMIVDAITKEAVANMPDKKGNLIKHGDVYLGTLSQNDVIGITASYIFDELWGMITWGFINDHYDDFDFIVQAMAHELFHAKQTELFKGSRGGNPDNDHMDELEARVSVRMEINALMGALESTGTDRIAAIKNALSIRAERRNNYENAAVGENVYEISEGTAVYTDTKLTINELCDIIIHMEEFIENNIVGMNMRLFGYATGALYGFLLDELGADWKNGLRFDSDLGVLLQDAAGITELIPFDSLDLELYDYMQIKTFETLWVEKNTSLLQEAYEIFSEPVLRIPDDGDFVNAVDTNNMLYLQDFEFVYSGSFVFDGEFGLLFVTDGFLLMGRTVSKYEVSARDIKIDGNLVTGPNWEIKLHEGFEIREIDGQPDGNFTVVRS